MTAAVARLPAAWRPYVAKRRPAKRPAPAPKGPRPVPARPVRHRKPSPYVAASQARAAALVRLLEQQGAAVAKHRMFVVVAVACALDDARTAGFGAGVAWARGKK